MFLTCTLEDVKNMLRDCGVCNATIGILVADYRQPDCKNYIINYLSDFDTRSGSFIDFYIPGYRLRGNTDYSFLWHFSSATHQDATVEFDCNSFEQAIREIEAVLSVQYTYNPLLILVDVDSNSTRVFKSKIVIELDDNDSHSVRRSGLLFREIFEYAKHDNSIRNISYKLEKFCLAKSAHSIVEHLLQGDYITACATLSRPLKYRLRGQF